MTSLRSGMPHRRLAHRGRATWLRATPAATITATVIAAVIGLATGCSAADGAATPAGAARTGDELTGTVTVLAAASLTEPLTALAAAYEQEHPGVEVRLSFGSSTTLAQQVTAGAPADILATAGTAAADLVPADLVVDGARVEIATNVLTIVTPAGNPAKVGGLADLARSDLDVVLCAKTAPCGKAADEVLARAKVSPHTVSREVDVRATLAKVRLDEADAAVVYHSDAVTAGDDVTEVAIDPADNTVVDYPLLLLDTDPAAVGFVGLVTGPQGRQALDAAGFLAPPAGSPPSP